MAELDVMSRHERRRGLCWPLFAAQSANSIGIACDRPLLAPMCLNLWLPPLARELP